MFIETHKLSNSTVDLAFVKSDCIQVFPCGRRRSTEDSIASASQKVYIPFDPEARLNTEANNRKHSALNGYDNTFITPWNSNTFELFLAGYQFKLKLNNNISTMASFVNKLLTCLNIDYNDEEVMASIDKIYANIRIEDIPLFSGYENDDLTNPKLLYKTSILRNQSDTQESTTSLDLLKPSNNTVTQSYIENFDNYYFSGLSFSTAPITDNFSSAYNIETITTEATGVTQHIVSLCVFIKNSENIWQLNECAKLPEIRHGEEPGSICVGKIHTEAIEASGEISANEINASEINSDEINASSLAHAGKPAITLDVKELDSGKWQLQFTHATTVSK